MSTSDSSYEKLPSVQAASVEFEACLRQALIDGEHKQQEHLNDLLKPLCTMTGAFSALIRLQDEHLKRMHIVARHCPGYEEVLDHIGARKVGLLVSKILEERIPCYLSNNIHLDPEFKKDLERARSRCVTEPDQDFKVRYQKYLEYLEEIGPTIISQFKLRIDQNFTGLLFVCKRVGETWEDHEIRFIQERVPFVEMMVREIKFSEQKRGTEAIQKLVNHVYNRDRLRAKILKAAQELTGCDVALLRNYERPTNQLRLVGSRVHTAASPIQIPTVISNEYGISGIVVESQEACIISNTVRDRYYKEAVEKAEAEVEKYKGTDNQQAIANSSAHLALIHWIKSAIGIPMTTITNTGVDRIGRILVLISNTPDKFGPKDLFTMQAFAADAAHLLDVADFVEGTKAAAKDIAHHLGNRLTSISLGFERMRKLIEPQEGVPLPNLDVKVHEILKRLERSILDARHLEIDLKDATYNLPLSKKIGHLNQAILEILQANEQFSSSFSFQQDPSLPEMEYDIARLKWVLDEMMHNSHDEGAKHMNVSLSYVAAEHLCQIRIRDDGHGIPSRIVMEIFAPGVSFKPNGNGFGLAIVKKTVEQHGGTMTLEHSSTEKLLPVLPANFLISLPVKRKIG